MLPGAELKGLAPRDSLPIFNLAIRTHITKEVMIMVRTTGLLLASALLVGCGTTGYAYVPAAGPTAEVEGTSAADYGIPPTAPTGDLRVLSYGIEDLTPETSPDQAVSALHVRLYLSDLSGSPWTLDTREQQLVIPGRGPSRPALANASPGDGSKPPLLTIAPKSSRVVDLYFPLPPDMQKADAIADFQVQSLVQTEAGPVSEATPFERIETEGDERYAYRTTVAAAPIGYDPYLYSYDELGSPFYYDPLYVGFYGGVMFPPVYAHPGVYARGWGWGHGGYYHGGYYHGYSHGYRGGYHGGGHYRRGGGYHGGGHGHH